MNKVATVLLFVNFVTVLFPQPGYIHPDEFFQSSEIVAGDILNVAHARVWEFNSTSPVRNIVFPYLLTSPSLLLLRYLNSTNFVGCKISTVKIVMATRLPMAFISLFGYYATGHLARHFETNEYLCKVVWCSSYVTWTYFTRTFSNSVEACLLALILLLTMDNLSDIDLKKLYKEKLKKGQRQEGRSQGDQRTEKSKTYGDDDLGKSDSNEIELSRLLTEDTGRKSLRGIAFILGFLIIAGFYNRPTFLLFAFIPMFYWFFSACLSTTSFIEAAFSVMVWNCFGMFSAFLFFIAADTFYYNPTFPEVVSVCIGKVVDGQLSGHSLQEAFNLITSSIIITPWNFIKYNMNADNLAQHGLHPHYTHFLINIPLLLGPLFFPFIAACMLSMYQQFRGMKTDSSNSMWLVLMAVVPIAGLSLFPHQEPRFLIPLFPVFIVVGVKLVNHMASGKKLFLVMWVFFNLILNLIYGYVHQAAMIPALSIYQQKLSSPKTVAKLMAAGANHAFFYKTYPPPRHLLLLDPGQNHFQVHDLAGSPIKDLVLRVKTIEKERWQAQGKNQVFIFMPSRTSQRVTDLLRDNLKEYNVQLSTTSICPHLSTESLPRFKQFWAKKITFDDFIMDFCLNIVTIL